MSSFETAAATPPQLHVRVRKSEHVVSWLFGGTLFVSALLVFSIEPMFTKLVLPRLGGAPAVWSVALVFFQGAVLAGYGYAHLLVRFTSRGLGALIHLAVLAIAALTLPMGIAAGFGAAPESFIGIWLIALFAASIGLPFMALSASAPLIQAWFATLGERNPYVLYAASNLGSFAGLLAYPFAIEPMLSLHDQSQAWSFGFAGFAALITCVAVIVSRGSTGHEAQALEAAPAPTAYDRLAWMAFAAIPSGLVVAVTVHLTTDVAAAPFLWVVPLALYLLTFVAIFRDQPWIRHETVVRVAAFVAAPLVVSVLSGSRTYWMVGIVLNLAGFVALTMLCHGALYARRPAPARLTEFYLWISFGGVLGGAFAALIAPNIFNGVYEYPILICAALLALPGAITSTPREFIREAGVPLALAVIVALLRLGTDLRLPLTAELPFQLVPVTIAALMLVWRRRPARLFALAVLAFTISGLWRPGVARLETARSFFGVHEVDDSADGTHHILVHGTTIHGVEAVRGADGVPLRGRPEPLSYYYAGGPYAYAIEAVRKVRSGLDDVAIVGLGAGVTACHRHDGESWTFFEIDPEVVRIARDARLFRALSTCAPNSPVILGDARLSLTASSKQFDLIALDAFTSDAIPVHLLTLEALEAYMSRLKPHGVILAHISNRHMDLAPVLAATAAQAGLAMWLCRDTQRDDFAKSYRSNAELAVLARADADVGELPSRGCWQRVEPRADISGWTDDYSDLLRAILRRKLGHDAPLTVIPRAG
jgi:hypothetical protein